MSGEKKEGQPTNSLDSIEEILDSDIVEVPDDSLTDDSLRGDVQLKDVENNGRLGNSLYYEFRTEKVGEDPEVNVFYIEEEKKNKKDKKDAWDSNEVVNPVKVRIVFARMLSKAQKEEVVKKVRENIHDLPKLRSQVFALKLQYT